MAGRLTAGLFPAVLTGLFGALVAEDRLSFGGGEKDLLLVIPLGLWSLLYGLGYLFLLRRGRGVGAAMAGGAAAATAIILGAGLALSR